MKKTSPRAFSLVEVALALGVISFAVLALLGLILTAQQSSRESIDSTDNTLLFEKVVSQLKLKPYHVDQQPGGALSPLLPLPPLNANLDQEARAFVVDEQYRYVGDASDPMARSQGTKVVRVLVKDSIDLNIESMHAPTKAAEGQLALVRVEISGPAEGYNENKRSAPNMHVFETEIGVLEQ